MIASTKEKIQNYLLKGAMRYQSIKDFNVKNKNQPAIAEKSRSPSPDG